MPSPISAAPARQKAGSSPAKTAALLGILGAQALVLSYLESLIPAMPGLPPGAKPGFSNIVNMFAAARLGLPQALAIVLVKALFAFVTRGWAAALMSFSGGLLSTAVMYALWRAGKRPFGIVGISVLAAAAHNAGQLAAAAALTGTCSIAAYAPLLAVFAVVTGTVTGLVMRAVMPALEKQSRYFAGDRLPEGGNNTVQEMNK
ncbi:MAG TPA: Gx transporter family protein [Clostridiales bacterium]|nr:MAG: Heptaprenyl diphosphate synthase component I [Firmicutes bacterium ADurb.Bin262]HOU09459.1 Gx transporter family protein [Clostridiales bacterium]HQK73260.1 Gx transporter family protein [Clostridiales bacterium]